MTDPYDPQGNAGTDGVQERFRETFEVHGPRCPYCDHMHRPDSPSFYDENAEEMECEHCCETFDIVISTSTTWTCTARQP